MTNRRGQEEVTVRRGSTRPQPGHKLAGTGSAQRVRRTIVGPLKILLLSAEVAPFAKAGGLGDVCGSLPKALAALGHEVRVVMPAYQSLEAAVHSGEHGVRPHPVTLQVPLGTGKIAAGVLEAK